MFLRVRATMASLTMLAVGIAVSAQSPGEWKPLLNGKDLTGWTVAAGRGGGNAPPQPAQWKVENGVLVGGQGTGRGSLVTNEQYKDFELDFEFMLTELGTKCSAELIGEKQENASEDRSCLYNSGVTFRTGYQVNIGRREAGEFIGIVVHRKAPGAIRGQRVVALHGRREVPGPSQERRLEPPADHGQGPAPHRHAEWQTDLRCEGRPDRPRGSQVEGGGPDHAPVAAGGGIRGSAGVHQVPEHADSNAVGLMWHSAA